MNEPVLKRTAIGLREIGLDRNDISYSGLPTINEATDWLYEKHEIVIVVVPYYESKGKLKWVYSVFKLNENMGEEISGNDAEIYGEPTRTEAQTAGIDAAITYIKNLKNGTK